MASLTTGCVGFSCLGGTTHEGHLDFVFSSLHRYLITHCSYCVAHGACCLQARKKKVRKSK
jgi:hypothetical protein